MLNKPILRLLRGTAIYGTGYILQRFLGFLLLPLFTRILTPSDYGVIALIGIVTIAFSSIYTLGTGNSMAILYFEAHNLKRRSQIIWTTAVLLICNSIFFTILGAAFAPQISNLILETTNYANLLQIALITLLLTTITEPFYAYLRMEEKQKTFVILTTIDTLLTLIISIITIVVLHMGIYGMFISSLISKSIMILVTGITVGCSFPYKFSIDMRLVKSLIKIGFPSIFGLFAFLLIDFADRQMIQRLLDINALGIYSIGYNFGMIMLLISNAFSIAWPPFFMSFIDKPAEANTIFGKVLKYYIAVFGTLAVLFFIIAKPVTLIMTAPAFHSAFTVVGLVAAAYMLKGCYLILLPGIYFAKKLHWQSTIEWFAAIINIGLNFILIPKIGIIGAACATFLSYLCLPILSWVVSRKYLKITYEKQHMIILVASVIITASITFLLSFYSPVVIQILLSLLILAVLLIVIFMFVLDKQEKHFLYKLCHTYIITKLKGG